MEKHDTQLLEIRRQDQELLEHASYKESEAALNAENEELLFGEVENAAQRSTAANNNVWHIRHTARIANNASFMAQPSLLD